MGPGFIAVLVVVMLGTSQAFAVAEGNTLNQAQIVYRLGLLGDFEAVDFENDPISYVLFLACTSGMTIVSLNLLIAVISDTYERIQMQSVSSTNKGKAHKIYELECVYGRQRVKGGYLVFFRPSSSEGGADEPWQGRVSEMKADASRN